jgi:H+/gluconate symporter-like permease
VVAFSVYPFAAELFRAAGIPKRLIPAAIALGAFTFTMDALPGTPQIQNIIPTTFFHTDAWAAPRLGLAGGAYVFLLGMTYLEWRRRRARRSGEGYGEGHLNEPAPLGEELLPRPVVAVLPLILVALLNKLFTGWIARAYGHRFEFAFIGAASVAPVDVDAVRAIWAVEGALLAAILLVVCLSFARIRSSFNKASGAAVSGAMLAALNTGSEYGFGAVIAVLPGFKIVSEFLSRAIHDTLLNVAVTTNILAGITGSASGGMSIVLASMGQTYLEQAQAAGISAEVLHRVTAMASGGMDTLPHNGAVITLLVITGLSHRQSYKDIFAMTIIKTSAVAVVIGLYYLFGIS